MKELRTVRICNVCFSTLGPRRNPRILRVIAPVAAPTAAVILPVLIPMTMIKRWLIL